MDNCGILLEYLFISVFCVKYLKNETIVPLQNDVPSMVLKSCTTLFYYQQSILALNVSSSN